MLTQRIPIFRAGSYPQGDYPVDRIQRIVQSYNPVAYEAPVKIGHSDDDTKPALAWVESLALEGDILYANITKITPQLIELTRTGQFQYVSAEFYPDDRLAAVAILGARGPQIKGLPPLSFSEEPYMVENRVVMDFVKSGNLPKKSGAKNKMSNQDQGGDMKIKEMAEAIAKKVSAALKGDSAQQFSETQIQDLVTKELDAKVDDIKLEFAAELKKEKDKTAAAEAEAKKFAEEKRKGELKAFTDELKKQGKLVPAFERMGILDFMAALDPTEETLKFSEEEKKVSRLEWFKKFLSGLPKLIDFAEFSKPTETKVATTEEEKAGEEIAKAVNPK